ncbi:MAG: BamA/TamA family outer membrane protein, partial [Gemmatimonadales bacterium]|nr:BamA/TamA family outer membrane protein [Gemmatimonadales bacterium]
MRWMPQVRWITVATLGLLVIRTPGVAAQDSTRTIDFSTTDTLPSDEIPEPVLRAAIAQFNAPTTTRTHGTLVVTQGNAIDGTLGIHRGTLRIAGIVRGNIVVLNGDVRIDDGGRVIGDILVLGGRIVLAPAAVHQGTRREYGGVAPVGTKPDGTIAMRPRRRGLSDYTSASATFVTGPVQTTVRAEADAYNRVEGLPIVVGPTLRWRPDEVTAIRVHVAGIIRTAADPDGLRKDFGWRAGVEVARLEPLPITLNVDGGSAIVPIIDRAFSSLESGLSAFLLRRDYRDWMSSTGVGVSLAYRPHPVLSVTLGAHWDRERTVRAVDAFTVLRASEVWRPNPAIDDGDYRTFSASVQWDSRDDNTRPLSGWLVRGSMQHVTSDQLSPITLPSLVRDDMPTSGYGSTAIELDLRRYLRLDPRQSVHLRLAGAGWVGGDPLTVQRRRSMGGAHPLSGYGFREVTCDRRRRPDPA